MTRGVCTDEAKGVKRVQKFRRTYFSADWTDGVLVQARLWGPHVLKDGSALRLAISASSARQFSRNRRYMFLPQFRYSAMHRVRTAGYYQ